MRHFSTLLFAFIFMASVAFAWDNVRVQTSDGMEVNATNPLPVTFGTGNQTIAGNVYIGGDIEVNGVIYGSNIGIGTTSVSSALSVVGDILATGAVSGASYNFTGTGERFSGASGFVDLNDLVDMVKIEPGIYTSGNLAVDGAVYIGNIRFAKSTDTLSTEIAATPSGGMLVLAPGATYTVSSAISRVTPIFIEGNWATINSSLAGANYIATFTAQTYIRNLNINHTAGNSWGGCFYFNGTGGNIFPVQIEHINLTGYVKSTGNQAYTAISAIDVKGIALDTNIYFTNESTAGPQMVYPFKIQANSTAETAYQFTVADSSIYIDGQGLGAGSRGIYAVDSSATVKLTVLDIDNNIYSGGPNGVINDGLAVSGSDAKIISMNSFVSGGRYDAYSGSTGRFSFRDTILDHNTCANCYGTGVMQDTTDYLWVINGTFKGNVGIGTSTANAALVVGSGGSLTYADGAGDGYFKDELEADGAVYLGDNTSDRVAVNGTIYFTGQYVYTKNGVTCYRLDLSASPVTSTVISCSTAGY